MGMQLRLLYGGIPCPQNGILKPHNYGETQIMPFGKGLVLCGRFLPSYTSDKLPNGHYH